MGWAVNAKPAKENLDKILNVAITGYANQTNWFLEHKNTGLKYQGALLASQVAIISFYYSDKKIPELLAITSLIFLGIVSPLLANAVIGSCKRSYLASLEHVFLINKTLWAMGFSETINVDSKLQNQPGADDDTLNVPRYVNNSAEFKTCEDYCTHFLNKKGTTLRWSINTLRGFGFTGLILGFVGAINIWIHLCKEISVLK